MEEQKPQSQFVEQLLISRYLFREGVRAIESRLPFAPSLAVSLFQDAAELLLSAIAVHVDAKVRTTPSFMDYWQVIETAPKNAEHRPVPSKAALTKLNSARVAFKHHGQRVSAEDAARFRVDTEVFLKEATDRFFGIEFEDISLADLIARQDVRDQIREAERHFAKEQYEEVLICCALAEYDLWKSLSRLIPAVDLGIGHAAGRALSRVDESTARAMEEITKHIAGHLQAHRTAILLMMSDTPVEKYSKFRSIAPGVVKSFSGVPEITWMHQVSRDKDGAAFCIDYIIDLALRLQQIRRPASTPRDDERHGEE
jgi:hypothetical protein